MGYAVSALGAALFLFAGTAPAAPLTLPGTACADYALERRGDDLAVTCPGPWSFYTAPKRTTFATIRGWYNLCAYHVVLRAAGGVTLYCVVKR